MTRQTFHCYCGFTQDHPGTCPTCGDVLHPKHRTPMNFQSPTKEK